MCMEHFLEYWNSEYFYLKRGFVTKSNPSEPLLEWLGQIMPVQESLHIEGMKLYDLGERNTD